MLEQSAYPVSAPPITDTPASPYGLLRRNLAVSVVVMVIALGAGVTALKLLPKEYSAYAILAVENTRLRSTPSEPLFTDVPMDLFTTRAATEIANSPLVVQGVIDRLHLWDDPELNEPFRETSPVVALWDGLRTKLHDALPSAATEALAGIGISLLPDRLNTLQGGAPVSESVRRSIIVDQFQKRLSVSQVPQSLMLQIQYRSRSPEKAMNIVNELMQVYMDTQLREKVTQLQTASQALDIITDRFHERMVQSQNNLRAYLQKLGRLDLGPVGGTPLTMSGQATSDLNNRLLAARTERIEMEARLKELRDAKKQSPVAALSVASFATPMIQQLRDQRAYLSRQMAHITTAYGPRHPTVIQMSAQIAELDRTVNAAIDDLIRSRENELRVARDKEASLDRELKVSKDQTMEQSSIRAELVELEAQAQAAKSNYEAFLAHMNKATGLAELQRPDAKPVKQAVLPLEPSFPRPLPILALATIAGLFASAGVAWRRECKRSGFSSIDQIEDMVGTPVLGILPKSGSLNAQGPWPARLAKKPDFQSSIERLRLWLSTTTSNEEGEIKVLMVASSLPREGKSTVSWALAAAAAAAGQRVLLIQGDTRKATAGKHTGDLGLVNILNNETSMYEAVQFDEVSGVHVLPAGPVWRQPIGHSQYRSLNALISCAAATFDLVIIDSPPILAAPDAKVYAQLADRLLFLINWNETSPQTALRGLSEIERSGGNIAGVCINGIGSRDMRRLIRASAYGYLREQPEQPLAVSSA